jgi:hypothetical protein
MTSLLVIAIVVGAISGSAETAYHLILLALQISGIPLLLSATEQEKLPDDQRVPRHPFVATLAAPWLPGGGRGSLFLILHLASAFGALWILRAVLGSPTIRVFQIGVTCLFATIYVLLPCAALAPLLEKPMWRRRVRYLIPGIMVACWVATAYLNDASHVSTRALIAQVTNPWALGEMITWDQGRYVGHPYSLPIVGTLAAVAILGNTGRMLRGIVEVATRSRHQDRPA